MAEMSDLYQKLCALSGHVRPGRLIVRPGPIRDRMVIPDGLLSGFRGAYHRPFGLMLLT